MKKYLLIFLLLSLSPLLWWILPGHIVDSTDIVFPLNPIINVQRSFFAWDPIYNTGSYAFGVQLNLAKFPLYLFFAILQFIGFSLTWTDRIWFFVLLISPMLAMFFFLKELLQKNKNTQILTASFVGAVFYVFNLYYMHMIMDEAIVATYFFTPLILYLFLRGIRKKQILFHAIYIAVVSFFYSPVNPNSYIVGPIFITSFIFFYLARAVFIKNVNLTKLIIKFIVLIVILSTLTNFYWLLPYGIYLSSGISEVQAGAADWLTGVSKYTNFSNVVRLMGAWDWFEGWNGEQYLPYSSVYINSPIMKIFEFIPPLFVLIGLWKGKNNFRYFFLWFALWGIILAMGSNSPTRIIYYFFYDHVPFFWIFRSPWYKFSFFIAISYTFFITLFTTYILNKWKSKKIIVAMVLLFLILSHPIIFGTRLIKPSERHGNLPALQVNMPSYVFEAADWFNQQKNDDRVVMVPQVAWESTAYTWQYGNLMAPLFTLNSKNPVLTLPYDRKGPGVDLLKAYKLSLYNPESTPSANFLDFLNARYVINQKDFSYYYFRAPENAKDLENLLSKDKSLKKIKNFGEWDIYEYSNVLPKIYATSSIIKLRNIEEVGDLDISKRPAFVLENNKISLNSLKLGKTKISFNKKYPTNYTISVKTDVPFYLVFSEAFHPGWQLYLNDKKLETKHFTINSYGNGYLIDKIGDYKLELKFMPQRNFNIGYIISLSVLILLLMFILIRRLK